MPVEGFSNNSDSGEVKKERPSNNSKSKEANELDVIVKIDDLSKRIKKLFVEGEEKYEFKGDNGERVVLSWEKNRYCINTFFNVEKDENGKKKWGSGSTRYELSFNKGNYNLRYGSTVVYSGGGRKEDGGTIKNLSPSEIIGNIIPRFEKRIEQAEDNKEKEKKKKELDAEKEAQERRARIRDAGRKYAQNENPDKRLQDNLNNLA